MNGIIKNDWRAIVFRGMHSNYLINSDGVIVNKDNMIPMVATPNHGGYLRIGLYINGHRYLISVHRLVAEAFVLNPDPEHKTDVNHIDGNKKNNKASNLEWVTKQENSLHAVNTGLITRQVDDPDVAKMICDMIAGGTSTSKIAKLLNISLGTVEAIKRGRQFADISKNYNFNKMTAKEISEKKNKTEEKIRKLNLDMTFPDKILIYQGKPEEDPTDNNTEYWSERLRIGRTKSHFRVSSHGRIMNEKSMKILVPAISNNGFLRIGLYNPDEQQTKMFTLHILVGNAFIFNDSPGTKTELMFIDNNPLNCKVSNLKWVSPSKRIVEHKDFIKTGTKLTESDVREICEMIQANQFTCKEIASKFNVTPDTVAGIKCGRRWAHISKDYKFPDKREIKSNFAKIYPEIDKLIIQGYRTKDIVKMIFVENDREVSLRNTISKRRKYLKDNGIIL